MKRAIVRRRRELLATTMVTAAMLATCGVGMLGGASASAAGADPTTTVAPTTTEAPAVTADSAAPAVVIDSTTTTEAPTTTTSAAPATTTTIAQTVVEGSQQYATACTNNATAATNVLTFNVTADALSPVITGADLTIHNQHWTVSIPADLSTTLRSVFGSIPLDTTVQVTVAGTNVQPTSIQSALINTQIDLSGADGTEATGAFDVPDMTFQPVNPGTAVFSMTTIITNIPLGDGFITVNCLPDPAASFLSVDTYGAVIPTTTTTPRGPTTTAKALADSTLPITGANSRTLWIEVLTGLLLVQIGLLAVTVSRKSRTRQTS